MRKNMTWSVLIIASMMVVGAFSGALTAPDATGVCASGTKLVKMGATAVSDDPSTWTDVCVPDADLVADCYVYIKSDSSCKCDSTGSFDPITILAPAGDTKPTKGCVPLSQQILYAKCTRTGVKQYDCQCTATGRTTKVDLVAKSANSRNTLDLAQGCSNFNIPNCKKYKLQALSGSDDDFICNECNAGATAFSIASGTTLLYAARATDLKDKGCPIDGTWQPNTCKSMKLTSGSYECDCSATGLELVTFVTTSTQKITQGCATTSDFYSKDANCKSYSYGDTSKTIKCFECKDTFTKIDIDGDAAAQSFTQCVAKASLIEGCNKYHADSSADIANKVCIECKTEYDSAPTGAAITVLNLATAYEKMCLPKGRWSIDTTLCKSYKKPVATTSVYLECTNDASCTGATTGLKIPCYLTANPLVNRFGITTCVGTPSGTDFGGFAVKKSDGTGACITSGIIQNCEKYTTLTSAGAGSTCQACDPSYTLVDTQQSKATASSTPIKAKQVCIPDTIKDPNCDAYTLADFTCYRCTNGLTYNKALKRCATPTDATSGCKNAYTSGDKVICLSCQNGYTMIYSTTGGSGTCVSSVEKCAFLSASGCSLCVDGYQLVTPTQCVKLPPNCQTVNAQGVCTLCRIGFATDSQGQCVRTNQNTCPPGQVPSNGECVPVQVTIPDCLKYTVDSKCAQCLEGKTPSADGSSCVSSDRPGAKPCPPNTNTVIYRRNPSNPLGDCVAVDIRCANARDDGFCISCKDNEYAHSDGRCYRIVTVPEGGN